MATNSEFGVAAASSNSTVAGSARIATILEDLTKIGVLLGGIHTNILLQEFSDKVLVVVTQYRKIGTLTLVTEDAALSQTANNIVTYTTQVLLGDDTAVTQVIARCIASAVCTKKPVLVAAALKNTSKEMIKAVCEQVTLLTKQR